MAKTDPKAKVELEVLQKCKAHLEDGRSIRSLDLSKEEYVAIADIFLLTAKPVMYVANVDEASMHTGNAYSEQLVAMAKQEGAEVIVMCNNIEAQISEMEDPDDKTYFTAGVQEVRAWTIGSGWKAPQAASVIHTDFEKGFIKAEVIAFDDYIKFKSEAACRDNGKLRIEGKEYIVKDGDVMHFRFNV
jgi:ribosome-binding ATPase YchF (GTP1/OBG family)